MALGDDATPLDAYFLGGAIGPSKKSPVKSRVVAGATALALLYSVNTTMASDITLGNNGNTEFGQGITQTTVCDSTIQVGVNNSYAPDLHYFQVDTFELSDIDSVACAGKTLTLRAFNGSSELAINPGSPGKGIEFQVSGSNKTVTPAAGINSADITAVSIESH